MENTFHIVDIPYFFKTMLLSDVIYLFENVL